MFPSIFVIVISLLNASTCAPSAALNRNDPGGHPCYSCASVDKPYLCNVTTQCRPDEQCYTDEYSKNHGSSIFSVGCRRISECYAAIVRRSDSSGRLKCEECCHGNLCNSGGCSAGPAKGDVCYSCRFIDDPRHCENETRCLADERCYIEKVLIQNFNIKYILGCVDRAECETLRQFGMSVGKRDTAISTMYASCCNGDKCNDVWFAKGITSDTPRTSLATPKHHPTTQSSYVTTSSSMTKDTTFVDATNGMSSTSFSKTKDTTVVDATSEMSSTSPSKTTDTTVVHTTSGMSCTSPLKTEDTTIVDTTSGAPSTSASKTKDTTVVDRTSGMSSTIPSKTKDSTVVPTTIGMPSTSPSKNKDATFVETIWVPSTRSSMTKDTTVIDTSEISSTSLSKSKDTTVVHTSGAPSTSPSKTKDTSVVDRTSGMSSTSPSLTKDTTVVHSSGAPSTSPSLTKDTTVVHTSGAPPTSPSLTKDTTVVHSSGAPPTSPSKTEDTTVFHTTSGTHFSLIPKSSLYTVNTMGHTATISPSTSTAPSKSTHDSHHPGLLCAHCDRVTDPLDCTYTTICEKDEACHIAHFVTSQGNLFYKLGCKAEQECQALHVGRRQNGNTVFDERCCTKHPECNRDLFKTSKDLSCGSCKDVTSPSDCEKVTTCRSNEVCERTVYLSDQFFLRYTLQCIQRDYCGGRVLHRTLSDDEYRDLCCDTNYCNMAVNKKYRSSPQYIMYMQVFLLLLLVTLTQGFSGGSQIETETNKWGTDIFYCTYHGIKFLPGSMWKTTECEQCSCFDDGLFCEGFGYAAGAFDAPEGCKVVNDGCDPRMVDAEDQLKPCVAK